MMASRIGTPTTAVITLFPSPLAGLASPAGLVITPPCGFCASTLDTGQPAGASRRLDHQSSGEPSTPRQGPESGLLVAGLTHYTCHVPVAQREEIALPVHAGNLTLYSRVLVCGATMRQMATMDTQQQAVLVVEDDTNMRRVLVALLKNDGYKAYTATDGEEAMAALRLHEVAAVITDLKMPRVDGLTLLRHINTHHPDLPVIIITAHGTVQTAVEAIKLGAFDFVTKPFEKEELKATVHKAVRARMLNLADFQADPAVFRQHLIGQSPAMQSVFHVIDRVADSPSTALLTGESGTGKELVAKALHQGSRRRSRPFIKVNCAAIPHDLMESELFGHERGAFTGAVATKPGRFELADTGTLFLDEIAEIPVEMQVKLLRAIQEQEFERVGGIQTIKVDVRLIAATNRDLSAELQGGRFRDDLYYRLNVVPINLPPLRDRPEDLAPLVKHFTAKYNERLGKHVQGLTHEALRALQRYRWPGNIRELENVIERTILFADDEIIDVDDLPPEIGRPGDTLPDVPIPPLFLPPPDSGLKDLIKETTAILEKQYIQRALEETHGNVTRAASLLKISRKSLQNKMKELGLRQEH
ncbi:MAG: sigma-54-dependent Fis family transcriptional regulator [Bradymonadales bacterium]|nr:sigma-54-dependent Fis family transcriptional regulator [Bradymonadales bacterium]